jgi:triacylglycerol lipase
MPSRLKIITCFLIYLLAAPVCTASDVKCVVLLHGLARSHHAMSSIESTLKQHSYIVVNQNYPSIKKSITALANQNIQPMVDACLIHHPTHIMFVTHSLGGIVLQKYLENHTVPNLSHIVMLSPPNHGSPLADLLHNNYFFRKIMGPAGQELTTSHFDSVVPAKAGIHFSAQHHVNLTMDPRLRGDDKTSICSHSIQKTKLSKVEPYQIGIIAGNFNLIPFSNTIFHGDNDGKVSVASARMNNMSDFIVLPVGHTFMMNNARVKKQIVHFLRFGEFSQPLYPRQIKTHKALL